MTVRHLGLGRDAVKIALAAGGEEAGHENEFAGLHNRRESEDVAGMSRPFGKIGFDLGPSSRARSCQSSSRRRARSVCGCRIDVLGAM